MIKKIISSCCMICILVLAASASVASADQTKGEKAGKGFVNIIGCWTEIPASPVAGAKKDGFCGFIAGIIQMPFKVGARAVGGATDVVSSPFTAISVVDSYPLEDFSDDKD